MPGLVLWSAQACPQAIQCIQCNNQGRTCRVTKHTHPRAQAPWTNIHTQTSMRKSKIKQKHTQVDAHKHPRQTHIHAHKLPGQTHTHTCTHIDAHKHRTHTYTSAHCRTLHLGCIVLLFQQGFVVFNDLPSTGHGKNAGAAAACGIGAGGRDGWQRSCWNCSENSAMKCTGASMRMMVDAERSV